MQILSLPDAGLPAQRPKGVLKARVNEGVMQMPQYVMVYLGGNQPSSPEEGKQHFAKYMEWLAIIVLDELTIR